MEAFLVVGAEVFGVENKGAEVDDMLRRWKTACLEPLGEVAITYDIPLEEAERGFVPRRFSCSDESVRDRIRVCLGFVVATTSSAERYRHAARMSYISRASDGAFEHLYKRRIELARGRWERFAGWAKDAEPSLNVSPIPVLMLVFV